MSKKREERKTSYHYKKDRQKEIDKVYDNIIDNYCGDNTASVELESAEDSARVILYSMIFGAILVSTIIYVFMAR